MRAPTLLNRVLDLPGVRVTGVDLGGPVGVVSMELRRAYAKAVRQGAPGGRC